MRQGVVPKLAKRVREEARQARREDETQRATSNLRRLFPNEYLARHIAPAPGNYRPNSISMIPRLFLFGMVLNHRLDREFQP